MTPVEIRFCPMCPISDEFLPTHVILYVRVSELEGVISIVLSSWMITVF